MCVSHSCFLLLCCHTTTEMTYFKYLADLEPVEVCMMIGTCMDGALAQLEVRRGLGAMMGFLVCCDVVWCGVV